jgi:pyrroloquinoline quinone (PQQ) biosynthesis protein C
MKTLKEILQQSETHDLQREVIFRMQEEIDALQLQLSQANSRVRELESQVFGGTTK